LGYSLAKGGEESKSWTKSIGGMLSGTLMLIGPIGLLIKGIKKLSDAKRIATLKEEIDAARKAKANGKLFVSNISLALSNVAKWFSTGWGMAIGIATLALMAGLGIYKSVSAGKAEA
jgi:hypothetical protein